MRKLLQKYRDDYRNVPCISSLALLPQRKG